MAATILIKRTQGTSPPTAAPVGTGVSFGELVYTYDVSNVGAGKSYKKLYIGHPDGNTSAPIAIGGEYYTDMLPENPADFGKPSCRPRELHRLQLPEHCVDRRSADTRVSGCAPPKLRPLHLNVVL